MEWNESVPLFRTCFSLTSASLSARILCSFERRALRSSPRRLLPALSCRAASDLSSASCTCGRSPRETVGYGYGLLKAWSNISSRGQLNLRRATGGSDWRRTGWGTKFLDTYTYERKFFRFLTSKGCLLGYHVEPSSGINENPGLDARRHTRY